MNVKTAITLVLAIAAGSVVRETLAEEPCDTPGSIEIVAHTCEGVLRARIECDQLQNDQVWNPTAQDRPNLPPKLARDAATDALIDAGLVFSHESAGRISLSPCGGSGGWVYLVHFHHSDLCGDSDDSRFLPVIALVLMDGQVVFPEHSRPAATR